MFVISVKSSKLKSILAAFAVIVVGTIGGIISVNLNSSAPVANVNGMNMHAENAQERLAFFGQFGWEIDEEPLELKEVIIPEEFDDTYERYNTLQKAQGLDLEKYKGKRVKLWSYEIKNYPGYENSDGILRGNLLVYNGVIIGGDICSIESDGFMAGFDGATGKDIMSAEETTTQAQM